MIKRLLILDGVQVVCHFRDDGSFSEGYGLMSEDQMRVLSELAHDYRRIVQGNADQLSMFSDKRGWTPPRAWVIRGETKSLCCVGNIVCVVENAEIGFNDLLLEMEEVSHW